MIYNEKPIKDDEIRVIGGDETIIKKPHAWKWLLLLVMGIALGVVIWQVFPGQAEPQLDSVTPDEPAYFDPAPVDTKSIAIKQPLSRAAETGKGFIEIADTTINDIPMRLYLPHDVQASLHVGAIDRKDPSILFAAQAADVRADNGGIVGAFVLAGEPKAWGLSKKGYCAIINDTLTIGVADNSPLFEEATEKGGYFFRQFPLVDKGRLVENEQRGKSVRRAICDRNGEVFTVETLSNESFHDFAQALVDLGVDNAIYMVGAGAYGWATDADGQRHEFGNPSPPKKRWKNISYLVMRSKG